MTVKLTIEYDGTSYCGWQIQPNGITVQEELEKALEKLTGKKVKVVGSGRTDAGVHASGQVASFVTDFTMPAERFAYALNTLLPQDIRVVKSQEEKDGFSARFSAKKKTYSYTYYESEFIRPLLDRYAERVNGILDEKAMQLAGEYLVGKHDFKCFLASNSQVKDTVREIYDFKVVRKGEKITFFITGNGFLYNMVRIIAGTLLEVGQGKIPPQKMQEILLSQKRNSAGKTLSAKGLTLISVEY